MAVTTSTVVEPSFDGKKRGLADKFAVADVDSHLVEPADLWTSRMSQKKWGDKIPRVQALRNGKECWFIEDEVLQGIGAGATAGWDTAYPNYPPTYSQCDPAGFDPNARLRHLDEAGIYYQVMYPNLCGFNMLSFLSRGEDFATECTLAYNDFITEFCSADPERLIALSILPFWDMPASLKELERTIEMGHRGVVLAAEYTRVDLPRLADPYWADLLRMMEESKMSVNFHFGFGGLEPLVQEWVTKHSDVTDHVKVSSLLLLSNARAIAEVVLSGLCESYPELDFVSVENGVGWVPYFSELMDWQWMNSEAARQYPDRLLPSEYVKRQLYMMYWFEKTPGPVLEQFEDRVMFETDFPHPTSLTPGPASTALTPREAIDLSLTGVSDEVAGKVLQHTATRLYRLAPPRRANLGA